MNPVTSPKVAAWARHLAQIRVARTFIEACEAEGIPVLPVKGIVSAYTLYDDPTEREVRDVDVRVRKRDYLRVGDLARSRQWRIRETKRAYYNYVIELDGVEVDVECTIGSPHVCKTPIEDMLARATPSTALGFRARLPEFTDHVVLQLVNVFKDKMVLAREAALRDLERIARHPEFDATRIAERLREGGVTMIGRIVADYAATDLGISGWLEVRDAIHLQRPRYARALRRTLTNPEGLAAILLTRAAADSSSEGVRAVAIMGWWKVVDAVQRRYAARTRI